MIRGFADRETQALFEGRRVRQFEPFRAQAERKLVMLQQAKRLLDLAAIPGNRLEALEGSRKGQFSIRINDRWRLCFTWAGEFADHVQIVDYHR
ncbi:MAG TPA: type II toxin-antitoxin system RelE/ParE family toxin [Candidatus Cybelea sp.]|nr:type II toxin-antitoxin system RelE/ParE family toxin [Candidatus Cybelea sp.]